MKWLQSICDDPGARQRSCPERNPQQVSGGKISAMPEPMSLELQLDTISTIFRELLMMQREPLVPGSSSEKRNAAER